MKKGALFNRCSSRDGEWCEVNGDEQNRRASIDWLILVYDRTAEERFPLKRKWYRFNYARATDMEIERVLRLVSKDPKKRHLPALGSTLGEWQVTYELSSDKTDTSGEILQYRHLFGPFPDEKDGLRAGELSADHLPVILPGNSYFEDENEQPITLTQILDCEAQRKHGDGARAINYSEPESILRMAPADPLRAKLWNSKSAALIAKLLDVYRQLNQSRWVQSTCVVSPSPNGQCDADLPIEEDCRGVILPFRQLYSQDGMDDLYNRCCKIHKQHCPPAHPTSDWVEHFKQGFNSFLSKPPAFPEIKCPLSARRYLDAFAYGAGLIHASNKKEDPVADLTNLLEANRREMVVMGYHFILRTLLWHVSMTIPVVQKNVLHWQGNHGWVSAPGMSPGELFG